MPVFAQTSKQNVRRNACKQYLLSLYIFIYYSHFIGTVEFLDFTDDGRITLLPLLCTVRTPIARKLLQCHLNLEPFRKRHLFTALPFSPLRWPNISKLIDSLWVFLPCPCLVDEPEFHHLHSDYCETLEPSIDLRFQINCPRLRPTFE